MYRTDLAAEQCDLLEGRLPEGINRERLEFSNLIIERVEVSTNEAAKMLGKVKGLYVTITAPPFGSAQEMSGDEILKISEEIAFMLPENGLILVAGIGNNDITPDAVGPVTARRIIATRHIDHRSAHKNVLGKIRPTAVLAPGVLGQTGMETSEIISSIVKDISPCAVIVVDALAARNANRLGNTIQISNSGISPGSGIMNHRRELSEKTLGVPVVSIGVPTVVDATTLASDLLDSREEDVEKRRNLFEAQGQTMMITPREIDIIVSHIGNTLALSINKAIQNDMTLEIIQYLIN